jgi:4-hydroxyphenylpyruvate dioxygenase
MYDNNFIRKVDYIELYVSNIIHSTFFYQNAFGFKVAASGKFKDENKVSNLLLHGDVKLILTSSKNTSDETTEQINLHGDFVKDIALEVENIEILYNQAVKCGFKPISPPIELECKTGKVKSAVIGTFGNTRHTLIERIDNNDRFTLPNYPDISIDINIKASIQNLDHLAIAVNKLEKWQELYRKGLNFYQFYQETIETKHSGMDSVVMNSQNDIVKFVFVASKAGSYKSQIEKFLDYNNDCGVQHLAFSTNDILKTVTQLKQSSIEFLPIPNDYYENLPDKLKEKFKYEIDSIKFLNILLDKDDYGYLLQIFTKPLQTRPTFFLELIQRQGATSFGRNNIMALFKAVEKQFGDKIK